MSPEAESDLMNRRYSRSLLAVAATLAAILAAGCSGIPTAPDGNGTPEPPEDAIALPEPREKGDVSVEEALSTRRSVRVYADVPLALDDAGQLLWAAQGITDDRGYRTAPSAGGLYPLEVYLVAGSVTDLEAGIYHYRPGEHLLVRVGAGDRRAGLQAAAINQTPVGDAPATIVIAAVPVRTTAKYGERGMRYVYMEAGHAAENVYLQAEALDRATVVIGAFDEDEVREVLALPENTTPLYLMPVGRSVPGNG